MRRRSVRTACDCFLSYLLHEYNTLLLSNSTDAKDNICQNRLELSMSSRGDQHLRVLCVGLLAASVAYQPPKEDSPVSVGRRKNQTLI